jgi:altronate dehydratase large subunit
MEKYFLGYRRADGNVGIRNHVLVIPALGELRMLAEKLCEFVPGTRTTHFPWEVGRSNKDRYLIERMFIAFGLNPNVSSVLVLGMEGPIYKETKAEVIKDKIAISGKPVEMLILKGNEDFFIAMNQAVKILRKMVLNASKERRQKCGLKSLSIAAKCGYSGVTTGISGNVVVGKAFDRIVNAGGKAFFSETTEIIGGEHILSKRAKNKKVAKKILDAADEFEKKGFLIGENIADTNPMPANIAAGLSTLEEKTLGSIAKSGSSIIEDVLEYAEIPKKGGLYFLNGPPNSPILTAGFAAAGAQLMLFQVGTHQTLNTAPSGSKGVIIPTSYITGNSETYLKNEDNMDFDSGMVFDNFERLEEFSEKLLDVILGICSGNKTKVETTNYQDRVELHLQDPVF